jgi:N-succinyldiaminopimelate aminotransferase
VHRYADVRGEPALLDAIVADLARRGRPVPRTCLQVTAGGTNGLDLAARALLDPGDEVLVLAPYWPLIRGIVRAAGAIPVELPVFTRLRTPGFALGEALRAAITPRTAAVYVNSPNNPTGVVLREDELAEIAAVAEAHGLWIFSDEAYERLAYGDDGPPTLWQDPRMRPRTIAVHTLSKSYGLAGARVAYLHGPEDAMARIAGLQTFATYCAPRPMQLLAARALAPESETWLDEARASYRAAGAEAAAALRIAPPEGGTFLFFDLRPHLRAGETPAGLLERCAHAGVVLTSGSVAGEAYDAYARLCFTCVPPRTLTRALATLERVLYASGR